MEKTILPPPPGTAKAPVAPTPTPAESTAKPTTEEIGGPSGPEPTRYGDWERGGRCSDF